MYCTQIINSWKILKVVEHSRKQIIILCIPPLQSPPPRCTILWSPSGTPAILPIETYCCMQRVHHVSHAPVYGGHSNSTREHQASQTQLCWCQNSLHQCASGRLTYSLILERLEADPTLLDCSSLPPYHGLIMMMMVVMIMIMVVMMMMMIIPSSFYHNHTI